MSDLTFNTYEEKATSTDIATSAIGIYIDSLDIPHWQKRNDAKQLLGILYMTLGLAGEAGEICNKVKKILRDSDGSISLSSLISLGKEVGDCQWYVSRLSNKLGYTLEEIAKNNLKTLQTRVDTDTLHGNGDNREEI